MPKSVFIALLSDAIKEWDWFRVLRYRKYLLPLSKSSGRMNYSIEVLNMLHQYETTLAQRQSQEFLWSRCVNSHSARGCKIPSDLCLEYLNRLCNDCFLGLKANKTEKDIMKILDNYDFVNNVNHASVAHTTPTAEKDRDRIVEHLHNCKIVASQDCRFHSCFPTPRDILHAMDKHTIIQWIIEHI